MNCLPLDDFKALNIAFSNDYHTRELQAAQDYYDEVTRFWPCTMLIYFETYSSDSETCYSLHRWSCHLITDKVVEDPIYFTIKTWDKKFDIYCTSFASLPNISNSDRERAMESHTPPKKIGVLSTRKISDWIDYYEACYKVAKGYSDANTRKIVEFMALIAPYNFTVHEKTGSLKRGGIVFSYRIESGYIEQRVDLERGFRSFHEFLLLSDNKYLS